MAKAQSNFKLAIPTVEGSGRSDSRQIVLEIPTTDEAGNPGPAQKMTRNEYIRMRHAAGVDRGTIRKEVSQLQGKDVSYQVIFQATKEKAAKASGADVAQDAEAGEAE